MSSKKNRVPVSPSVGDAPALPAKKQMCSIFDEEAPPPMRKVRANRSGGGDSTALCKVQGIVMRTQDIAVNGPKGQIPKRELNLLVTAVVANGAQDVIKTGVEGQDFLFPSKALDTPEQAERNPADKSDGFKAKIRELIAMPIQQVRRLSTMKVSFYKEGKDGGEAGVMVCEPGMCVEIAGVHINTVNSANGMSLFVNAGSKITCLMDKAPSPGALPAHMITFAKQEQMQRLSAFACSMPMDGYFDEAAFGESSPAQQAQMTACQALWTRLVEGMADRLSKMAEGKEEAIAACLSAHEHRIRQTPPAAVAAGDSDLFKTSQYDNIVAPVVQTGLTPWNNVPTLMQNLLGEPCEKALLPSAFTMPWIVRTEVQGKGLSVEMRVASIFDREQALEAVAKGETPVIKSAPTHAAIAISLSLRDFGVKFGSLLEEKVKLACGQVLKTCEFAAFPPVFNIDPRSGSMKSGFPEGGTLFVDMPKTLASHAIVVSEGFIKANMCGGGTGFVPPKVKADVAKLDFPDKVTCMPDLEEYGYQELTWESFDIENWSELPKFEFRVICPGVFEALRGNKELATNPALGDSFIKGAGAAPADTPAKIKAFLLSECLVYAVLA